VNPWTYLRNGFGFPRRGQTHIEVVDEKRRTRRIDTALFVYCHNVKKADPFEMMTCDVNVMGIKFSSPVRLKQGEVLEMKIVLFFHLPSIIARGRVVWCRKKALFGKFRYEGGIEFIQLSEKDKRTFQKFIDRHWMN
jgi:hypothetical protein